MSDQDLTTAHDAWDKRWADEQTRHDWERPEPPVIDAVPLLRKRGVRTVLDVGCGVGRHALYLSEQGFDVIALDASRTGLNAARQAAATSAATVEFLEGSFIDLPLPDRSVDFVLAWNVIYHGDRAVVQQALAEIVRTLTPNGLFQGTFLSKRHWRYGRGREIRPGTFVVDEEDEKSHPHFYCDAHEVMALIHAFDLFRLEDREQKGAGDYHIEILAELASE